MRSHIFLKTLFNIVIPETNKLSTVTKMQECNELLLMEFSAIVIWSAEIWIHVKRRRL